MPTVVTPRAPVAARKGVQFLDSPVSDVSRPATNEEAWVFYNFEVHARKCPHCQNPLEVYKSGDNLCDEGIELAIELTEYVYNKDGTTYSVAHEAGKVVRVEMPAEYNQARSLLRAIERRLHSRKPTPFMSYDKSYYVPARTPMKASEKPVKVEQPKVRTPKASRPHVDAEVVEWPRKATVDVSRRGSLYVKDMEEQRRAERSYNVEIREPSKRDIREHRSAGYYR